MPAGKGLFTDTSKNPMRSIAFGGAAPIAVFGYWEFRYRILIFNFVWLLITIL
jgi:hypothetical protein